MGCGGVDQHERVCIDVYMRPASVTPATVNVWLDIYWYVESVAWGFSDNQTLSYWGQAGTGATNFVFSAPSASSTRQEVMSTSILVPLSYAGVQTYGFGGQISGQYLGGTPSHVEYFNVPARPPSPPGVPGVSISNITQTSAYVTVTAPSSNGGAGIDAYTTQVWVSGGGAMLAEWPGGSGTASGLTPGTTYAVRSAAHNAAGWGAWSAWQNFTTIAGGMVKVGTAWQPAAAWVKSGTTWVRAKGVWKKGPFNTWLK